MLAGRQSRLRFEGGEPGRRSARIERENENPDDRTSGAERQVLRAHASQMSARVDEDGLEVGRLAPLHSAAELRRDLLAVTPAPGQRFEIIEPTDDLPAILELLRTSMGRADDERFEALFGELDERRRRYGDDAEIEHSGRRMRGNGSA